MDPEFARTAIGEYLVEDVRAVPPSPGLDTTAVLRDAVAARRRGKIRDAVLLILLITAFSVGRELVLLWTLVAAGVTFTRSRAAGDREEPVPQRRTQLLAIIVLLVLVIQLAPGFSRISAFPLSFSPLTTSSSLWTGALLLLAWGVLLLDEAIVDRLTRDRFRRSNFQPDARATTGWERFIRTLGLSEFEGPLHRVAAATAPSGEGGLAEVIVHRGWVPFVGCGTMMTDQTISLPLAPAEQDEAPTPFTAAELNAHVRRSMAALRHSVSLSPDRRLATAQIHEQVFVPSDQLLELVNTPLSRILADHRQPPAARINVEQARALADEPMEAGRYYLCLRIESWDRDLVTSCFFAGSTDQRTLYLEWSNSVLMPLRSRYRDIDGPAEPGAASRATLAAFSLPVTVLARIVALFHRYKPIANAYNEFVADRYGASTSLRELAAGRGSHNFFQDADIVRYVTLVEQALFRAVGDFLRTRGYSITEVLDAARSRIASNVQVITGGTFNDSAVGIGRVTQATQNGPQQGDRRRTQ